MKGTPTPDYLNALEVMADQAKQAIDAASSLAQGMRADRFLATWFHLEERERPGLTHPAKRALDRIEQAAAAFTDAYKTAATLSTRARRDEACVFLLLRACSTPQARSFAHRIEAALALHPELSERAQMATEPYLLSVRRVAIEMAGANDLAGLAQLAAALEAEAARSQAPGPSTPPGTAKGGLPS